MSNQTRAFSLLTKMGRRLRRGPNSVRSVLARRKVPSFRASEWYRSSMLIREVHLDSSAAAARWKKSFHFVSRRVFVTVTPKTAQDLIALAMKPTSSRLEYWMLLCTWNYANTFFSFKTVLMSIFFLFLGFWLLIVCFLSYFLVQFGLNFGLFLAHF